MGCQQAALPPDLALKFLGTLAERVSRTNERLLQQSFQTVAGRVASALLAQVISRQAEGAPEADVLIRSTQAEIANLEFLGSFCRASLRLRNLDSFGLAADFSINAMRDLDLRIGKSIPVALPPERLRVFDAGPRHHG